MPRIRPYTRADRFREKTFNRLPVRIPDAEIARKMDVCPKTVGNWRRNPETIPFFKGIELLHVLGVPIEEVTEIFENLY